MFQTKFVQKISKHFSCLMTFFRNRVFYGIMWKNNVQPSRPQMTNATCALHAEYLKLQTQPQNM